MPKIPDSISQLQSRNSYRDLTDEPVQSAGIGLDFQGIPELTSITQTSYYKEKEENIFESVLPQVQRELSIKYDNNLTAISNYSYVHERDDANNIIFNENGTENQLVVIEPITYKFDTEFINKTIDTRFSYFQFPATSIDSVDNPEFSRLNQELNNTFNELLAASLESYDVGGRGITANNISPIGRDPGTDIGNTIANVTGEGFISEIGDAVSLIDDSGIAINVLTDAIDAAPFNDVETTSRAIELSVGYDRFNPPD